jgi:uncharacterized protein (TIGR02453 family)
MTMTTTAARSGRSFDGFSEATFRFLRGLSENPSKSFWESHRDEWCRDVLAPMERLLAGLEPEFGAGKVLGMRRDNRFSPDLSPYKTFLGAVVSLDNGMCYYVEISAGGMTAAGGWKFNHPPDQVERYRTAVDAGESGEALARIASRLRDKGFALTGDQIKTVPRGFPPDHPRAEWLRFKTICAEVHWPVDEWMYTEEALRRVAGAWRETRPLVDWLGTHVGPSGWNCR